MNAPTSTDIVDYIDDLLHDGFMLADEDAIENGMPRWAARGQYLAVAFNESGHIVAIADVPSDERYTVHVLDVHGCIVLDTITIPATPFGIRALLGIVGALVEL